MEAFLAPLAEPHPFSPNVVVGPRMVGKTAGSHTAHRRAPGGRCGPRSILYLNLDLAADLESFRRLLHYYPEMRSSLGPKGCYIFPDEVTSVKCWWRVVKGRGAGFFRGDALVLTGSCPLKLRGRREGVAWPLSFREYFSVRGLALEQREEFDARHLPSPGRSPGPSQSTWSLGLPPLDHCVERVRPTPSDAVLDHPVSRLHRLPTHFHRDGDGPRVYLVYRGVLLSLASERCRSRGDPAPPAPSRAAMRGQRLRGGAASVKPAGGAGSGKAAGDPWLSAAA